MKNEYWIKPDVWTGMQIKVHAESDNSTYKEQQDAKLRPLSMTTPPHPRCDLELLQVTSSSFTGRTSVLTQNCGSGNTVMPQCQKTLSAPWCCGVFQKWHAPDADKTASDCDSRHVFVMWFTVHLHSECFTFH